MSDCLALPTGCRIEGAEDRILKFAREEYDYYDGIPSDDPDHVSPIDVMVTVAVNSFVNSAAKVRAVHGTMAASCDPLLAEIAEDADLRTHDLEPVRHLLHSAVQGRGVMTAVATKILHRKRRHLIPMLDAVVVRYYADALERPELLTQAVADKRRAADASTTVLEAMRADLVATTDQVEQLRLRLNEDGYSLSLVRILEILLWTEVEPAGYYRPSLQ